MRPRHIVALAALALTACADAAPAPDREAARLVAEGKAALARNEWSNAKTAFEGALARDAGNAEAHLGAAMADVFVVADILPYLSAVVDRATGDFSIAAADDESLYLTELVTGALGEIRGRFAAAEAHLGAAAVPGLVFRIDALPIKVTRDGAVTLALAGEWDRADALLLRGAVRAAMGLLDIALAVDLGFDFPRAHAYFTQPGFDPRRLAHLESLLASLLNDPAFPNFLGAAPGARASLQAAATHLGGAAADFDAALVAAAAERDDQGDDILRYVDADGNGRYDPPLAAGDACASVDGDAVPESFALLDAELKGGTAYPRAVFRLRCTLERLAANFAGATARPRINVMTDLLPVADVVVASVSTAEPRLTFGVPVPPGFITTVVDELLGDSIALDPYALVDTGGSLVAVRDLLPRWTDAPCPATGVCPNHFVIEMECAPLDATDVTLPAAWSTVFPVFLDVPVCRGAWVEGGRTMDTAHFAGAIAADGFVGYAPYIDWGDATFHGVLYLNAGATAPRYASSTAGQNPAIAAGLADVDPDAAAFRPATVRELSALMEALVSNGSVGGALLEVVDRL